MSTLMPTALAVQTVSGTDIPASPPAKVSPLMENSKLIRGRVQRVLHSRQKLRRVFVNFEQFSGSVVIEIANSLADVLASIDNRLVLTAPCFNIHDRDAGVEGAEVLLKHSIKFHRKCQRIFELTKSAMLAT
jgi:3-deoxy-D-arabino-heptulosonate 7-phosphate (DAHP) synthase